MSSRLGQSPDAHHRPGSLSGLGKPVFIALGVYAIRAKSMPFLAHKGRAERQGVSPRPRRPHGLCGHPARRFPAHGQWPSPTPKIVELNRALEADLRLRSAREWTLRLAACPGLSLAPTRPRSCELSPGHAF